MVDDTIGISSCGLDSALSTAHLNSQTVILKNYNTVKVSLVHQPRLFLTRRQLQVRWKLAAIKEYVEWEVVTSLRWRSSPSSRRGSCPTCWSSEVSDWLDLLQDI